MGGLDELGIFLITRDIFFFDCEGRGGESEEAAISSRDQFTLTRVIARMNTNALTMIRRVLERSPERVRNRAHYYFHLKVGLN